MPFQSMAEKVKEFKENDVSYFLFLHIREPEEIERAVKAFDAKTILVIRDSVKPITSNMGDANVLNYEYDFHIENNGTIDDLDEQVDYFLMANEIG